MTLPAFAAERRAVQPVFWSVHDATLFRAVF